MTTETKTKIKERARILAERAKDAYSADRYHSWASVAEALLRRGYTEEQAEAIMRSKWTRWAGDVWDGGQYGKLPARAVLAFLDDPRNGATIENVNRLVAGAI